MDPEPLRITELANEQTQQIDTVDPLGIVRLLCQSDAQLFSGWGGHPSVNDSSILEKLSNLSMKALHLLKENKEHGWKNIFVFSGCGTSGRIAWLCSRAYNKLLVHFGHEPCCHYLISGGDESLIISNELPEDDPPQGAEDLRSVCEGARHAMFFGITCGLSAPYVAGQVDYALHQSNVTTILMGFNPVSLSRNAPIEKWHKTCRDVFKELEAMSLHTDKAVLLNPIVGPESITGSTRMKGGSMTEILLDTIFLSAFQTLFGLPATPSTATATATASGSVAPGKLVAKQNSQKMRFQHSLSPSFTPVTSILDCFAAVYQAIYRHAGGVASLLSVAASCLCDPAGRLVYLGADTLGALGIVDASEMVDTYGAGLEEVRGFVVGGWEACRNTEGDLSSRGSLFRVSLSQFESDCLPHLTQHDCVICIHGNNPEARLQEVMERVLSSPAHCGLLVMAEDGQSADVFNSLLDQRYESTVLVRIPSYHAFGVESVFAGFGLKLVLNAVSTGANILKGRVYGNTMINLTLSNDKLFYRSVDIVRVLSGCSHEEATTSLLKAIYRDDNTTNYQDELISSHVKAATKKDMVVPLALILATKQCNSVSDAEQLLSSAKSLKTLIKPAMSWTSSN